MPLMRSFGAAKEAAAAAIRSRSSASATGPAYARELFAPLGPTYDRYARLLSLGQDPRWRTFLVSRVPESATRLLDVATGTAAVAIELARAAHGRSVVGVDQSSEMLDAGRARVAAAGMSERIELREGSAEARTAFYALRSGGWRDYVTLIHPPYTLWHLSYVAIGASIAPRMKWGLLGWTTLAFLLAMGVGAHALDELQGRPLRTRIPNA